MGTSQQKDLKASKAAADSALSQGYTGAMGDYKTAQGMYDPYVASGKKANALYQNAIGMNGEVAGKEAGQAFAASNPFRQWNEDNASNALMRQFNAKGMGNSGTAALASSRASMERGSQDWNTWLGQVNGVGQQGFQATGQQANLEQGMGDMTYGYGQQRAGNEINYGNALAQSRSTGINNLMGLGGLALKAYGVSQGIPSYGGK